MCPLKEQKLSTFKGEVLGSDKSVYFVSLGCPKNLVDTEIMLGSLLGNGFYATDEVAKAQVIIVNTCSFIASAREESVGKVMELSSYRESGALEKMVVAGCLTQRYKEEVSG